MEQNNQANKNGAEIKLDGEGESVSSGSKKYLIKKIVILILVLSILAIAGFIYSSLFAEKDENQLFLEMNTEILEDKNAKEVEVDRELDSDQDKLPDYLEKILGTSESNPDTDGDGYSDFDEIKNGYNPLTEEKYTGEEWSNVKEKIKGEDEGFYTKEFETLPTPTPISFICGATTVSDIDGNIYKTVKIGSQCWLKENLKVTKNPAGEAITRYCYDNDPKICETDGGLYDWNITMNNSTTEGAQGICPNGWHVPKDSEWYVLEGGLNYPGDKCDSNRNGSGCSQAGTRLQVEKEYSYEPHSGFDAIKSGLRLVFISEDNIPENYGSYIERNRLAYFWTSSEKSEFSAWHRLLPGYSLINREAYNKEQAFSLRCLKD